MIRAMNAQGKLCLVHTCYSDLGHDTICTFQEFVVMASNNLNDTLRLASIW